MDQRDAYFQLETLAKTLADISGSDSEQEIEGPAVAMVDAVISAARQFLPGHPIVEAAREILNPDAAAAGEPMQVRAVDLLVVVRQLAQALDQAEYHRRQMPAPVAFTAGPGRRSSW